MKKTKNNKAEKIKIKLEQNLNNDFVVGGVKITNPNKIMFESPKKIKKIEIVNYYSTVAERILPFLKNRIVSIVRCPDGMKGECFYKKHPTNTGRGIKRIEIKNNAGESEDYICVQNISGLIFETQMNTIELHIWGSSTKKLEKPDMMVFDLDPDVNMNLVQVRQGVLDLKNILNRLELVSFLKTSGGKGYHVVVPLVPNANWKQIGEFAESIAKLMEQTWPDKYTSNMRKEKRKGKIFVDWVRNGKGATSIAPYSLRAKQNATVSMPIKWIELNKIAPNGIDMFEAVKRLSKPDPWKDFFEVKQKLKPQ